VRIVKETQSVEGAKMVARFVVFLVLINLFVCMSKLYKFQHPCVVNILP